MSTLLSSILKRLPRWSVFAIDLTFSALALLLAFLLRFNFVMTPMHWEELLTALPFVVGVKTLMFLYFKTFTGIIKYTSVQDVKRIFKAQTGSFVLFIAVNVCLFMFKNEQFIPYSILIIDYFASVLFMAAFRVFIKILYYELNQMGREKINVIIYGAGQLGEITNRTLQQDSGMHYKVVAFVDDNPIKSRNTLDGVKIYYAKDNLQKLINEKKVELLIIAIQNIPPVRKNEIVETCLLMGVQVRNVPPVYRWINGELSFKQIKDISIEELLGRDQIQLENDSVKEELINKTIIVTGGAGSIGSEICRQISKYGPKKLVLIDQSESALYDIDNEIKELLPRGKYEPILADITNQARMEKIFKHFKPDLVFHAAAYKHVPIMEENPCEAISTNVKGTKILADLAVKYGVSKFVMISTDKAVNPTNVMGASKRISEIYTQSLNHSQFNTQGTRFITTRFGNVLGSSGSVIPRFKKQIMERGPITVTHPEIRRYFMTIPEATSLVLEAGAMGQGGEIFIFDMGDSVKIVDLAKKMVKLSGLTLGRDIQLIYTGLRPGEKLYEELLNDKENTMATHHPKIMIANVRQYEFEEVRRDVEDLVKFYVQQDNDSVVIKMKSMVPEFISQNSPYEKFDILFKRAVGQQS